MKQRLQLTVQCLKFDVFRHHTIIYIFIQNIKNMSAITLSYFRLQQFNAGFILFLLQQRRYDTSKTIQFFIGTSYTFLTIW